MDIAAGKIFNIGDHTTKRFIIGNGDEGREGTDGRCLPVYSIGCGAGKSIYTMSEETVS
jgi:hypothetical protein